MRCLPLKHIEARQGNKSSFSKAGLRFRSIDLTKYHSMALAKDNPPAGSTRQLRKKRRRPGNVIEKNSYNVGDAKAHLSAILEHVEKTGEEIVLTRRGKPVARVVSDRFEGGVRQLGFARGEIKLLPGWDDPVTFDEFSGK
jgi:prevent-host-death family protein